MHVQCAYVTIFDWVELKIETMARFVWIWPHMESNFYRLYWCDQSESEGHRRSQGYPVCFGCREKILSESSVISVFASFHAVS